MGYDYLSLPRYNCFWNNYSKSSLTKEKIGVYTGKIWKSSSDQWNISEIFISQISFENIIAKKSYLSQQSPVCSLLWRHNGRETVSNHQPHDYLLNRLFRRRSKMTWKLRVTGLCAGNSPVTGEFPAQRASNAENVSIWWRHQAARTCRRKVVRNSDLVSTWYWHLKCCKLSNPFAIFYDTTIVIASSPKALNISGTIITIMTLLILPEVFVIQMIGSRMRSNEVVRHLKECFEGVSDARSMDTDTVAQPRSHSRFVDCDPPLHLMERI